MKSISTYIIILLLIGLFTGCRKSPHARNNARTPVTLSESKKNAGRERNNNVVFPQKNKSTEERRVVNNRKYEGAEIFKKYNSAVFMVYTSDGIRGAQGSGFFIDDKGLAVSNYHVFKGTTIGAEQIKLVDGNIYKVIEVIEKSKEYDFIIFKVACSNTNYIPLAKSKPSIGDKVYAIGSPRGLENTFSSGEVSQWRDTYLMQISALIDHGSSGGALINEYGEVVGITSGTFYDGSQANLNYAWSIDVVKPYIN